MHIKILYTFFAFFFCFAVSAQTIRTKVFVIGGGAAGTGAAIQSAHSGVETMLIEPGKYLGSGISAVDTASRLGLEKNLVQVYKKSQNLSLSKLDTSLIPVVLKGWTDTVKNLKVMLNTDIRSIDGSGKKWKIKLSNGRKVKAEVIVDASPNGIVGIKAVPAEKTSDLPRLAPVSNIKLSNIYSSNLYRTAVVTDTAAGITPLAAYISPEIENLVFAYSGKNVKPSLVMGQAAGASAAYCAFFNTTTKKINIRVIQGELMAYGMWFLPFTDIHVTDPHTAAIQHIAATGILKGDLKNNKLYFMPDSTVSSEEIRQEMKSYYMRSQIWEPGKKIERLSLNNVLDLIKICGARGNELDKEVEKAWETSFGFKAKFDLNKAVTRRQFAVLIDSYLKPFTTRINAEGKIQN